MIMTINKYVAHPSLPPPPVMPEQNSSPRLAFHYSSSFLLPRLLFNNNNAIYHFIYVYMISIYCILRRQPPPSQHPFPNCTPTHTECLSLCNIFSSLCFFLSSLAFANNINDHLAFTRIQPDPDPNHSSSPSSKLSIKQLPPAWSCPFNCFFTVLCVEYAFS